MPTVEAPTALTGYYPTLFEADPTLEATLALADAGNRDALQQLSKLFENSTEVDPWHANAVGHVFGMNENVDIGLRSKLAATTIGLINQIKTNAQPGNPFLYNGDSTLVFGRLTDQMFDLKRGYPGVTAKLEGNKLTTGSGRFPDFFITPGGGTIHNELVPGIADSEHSYLRALVAGKTRIKFGLDQISQLFEPTPRAEGFGKEQMAMFYGLLAVNYLGLDVEVDTIPGTLQVDAKTEVLQALADIVLGQPAADKVVKGSLRPWATAGLYDAQRVRDNSIEDHPPRTIRALLRTVGVESEADLEGELEAVIEDTTYGYASVARQYGAIDSKDRIKPLVEAVLYV